VLFAELTETFCTNCSVRCTIRRSLVLPYLTSDLFEFHLMLDQSQRIFAEIIRTSNPQNLETFTQNFWSSVFFQALDQKLDLQRLGRSSELLVSESSEASRQIFRTCCC